VSSIRCDHCSFETTCHGGLKELVEDHPSFMRPDEQIKTELRPFRMQVLRLYPDFESHPIFNDYIMAAQAPADQDTQSA